MPADRLTKQRLEEIDARARYFEGVREPITGDRVDAFWLDIRATTAPGAGGTLSINVTPIRAALLLAQRDVPELISEIKRLRALVAESD